MRIALKEKNKSTFHTYTLHTHLSLSLSHTLAHAHTHTHLSSPALLLHLAFFPSVISLLLLSSSPSNQTGFTVSVLPLLFNVSASHLLIPPTIKHSPSGPLLRWRDEKCLTALFHVYQWSTDTSSLAYHWPTAGIPLVYHCSTTGLPLAYH